MTALVATATQGGRRKHKFHGGLFFTEMIFTGKKHCDTLGSGCYAAAAADLTEYREIYIPTCS